MKYHKKVVIAVWVASFLLFASGIQAQEYTITQAEKMFLFKNKKITTFSISVGDKIVFKNSDTLFHNIFSLSKSNKFNLGPTDVGDSKTVEFKNAGLVEIECIFHPKMFLQVSVQ